MRTLILRGDGKCNRIIVAIYKVAENRHVLTVVASKGVRVDTGGLFQRIVGKVHIGCGVGSHMPTVRTLNSHIDQITALRIPKNH